MSVDDQLPIFGPGIDLDTERQPVISNSPIDKGVGPQEALVGDSDSGDSTGASPPQIRRSAAELQKRLRPLASLRKKGAAALVELEAAIATLGDPEVFSRALTTTVEQAKTELRRGREQRGRQFNRAIAQFIRTTDHPTRETAVGWRVGPVELEQRAEDGLLRARYNRETVVDWKPVGDTADVALLVNDAETLLVKRSIPVEDSSSVFLDAFGRLSVVADAGEREPRIAIRDLLMEVAIVLVRRALRARRIADARAAVEIPRWALLHSVDVYRANSGRFSDRLTFETGGQRETAKIGVVLNGLDPNRQYESFCYVRRSKG